MKRPVMIGTRGSALAVKQAQEVEVALKRLHPSRSFEIKTFSSLGDNDKTSPISRFGFKGVFVAELETRLQQGEIDLAVHSLKDMPSEDPPAFSIASVTPRLDPRDVLIAANDLAFDALPSGARLGTGSPRRAVQLKAARRDVEILDIRGNIDTRLRKMRDGLFDGVVLAAAGLLRMGWQAQISQYLPLDLCLPAAGQGALAVEVRAEDEETIRLVKGLDHAPTRHAVDAERSVLRQIGGGCLAPVTAYASWEDESLILRGMAADPDALEIVRAQVRSRGESPDELARKLVDKLRALGADSLISAVKR